MAKDVLKEIIIVLLLCLAIILILGIILYQYVPMSKTLPTQVSYTTPEEVKEELMTSSEVDENQVIMTYEVDATDLNNYKKIQDYKPGKANPFSSYETTGTATTQNGSSTGSTTNSNGTSTSTNSSSSSNANSQTTSGSSSDENTSGGHFFQDKGTK